VTAPWLIFVAIAAALALGLWLERAAPHAPLRPAWRANLGLWAVGIGLRAFVFGAAQWTLAAWTAEHGVGLLNAFAAPRWLAVVASVLGLDAVSYLWHRANHALPFLWRFHRVHHLDEALSVSSALRFHPGEILLAVAVKLGAIAALGTPLLGVVVFDALFGAANALEHGNFDLPVRLERALGRVLITPALHRRHHSVSRQEHDANYGTIFSFWDRLGRSALASASAEQFPTGLAERDADPAALGAMLAEPFRATR
jgi:sterol desaturase/sphingolipid hydroxylase (fatty acid hydroxylase superfamily)